MTPPHVRTLSSLSIPPPLGNVHPFWTQTSFTHTYDPRVPSAVGSVDRVSRTTESNRVPLTPPGGDFIPWDSNKSRIELFRD